MGFDQRSKTRIHPNLRFSIDRQQLAIAPKISVASGDLFAADRVGDCVIVVNDFQWPEASLADMQRLFRVVLTALSTLESFDKTHESSFLVLLQNDFRNRRLGRHQRPARRAIRVFPYLYLMKLHGSGVISKE